ncbi:MAG: hypothetical protein WA637_25510 [Terriglobales bacterium]
MRDTVHTDFSELKRQVSERQVRTLVELVLDALSALDEHDGNSTTSDSPAVDVRPAVLKGKEKFDD